MGSVTLPTGGIVYVDSNVFIYTVEKHPKYFGVLQPFWKSVADGTSQVIVSELVFMEVLTGAYRSQDKLLVQDYESFLSFRGIYPVPISVAVLREAARLRARSPSLRTPDAIHISTASISKCAAILTNDRSFQNLPSLNIDINILDDLAH